MKKILLVVVLVVGGCKKEAPVEARPVPPPAAPTRIPTEAELTPTDFAAQKPRAHAWKTEGEPSVALGAEARTGARRWKITSSGVDASSVTVTVNLFNDVLIPSPAKELSFALLGPDGVQLAPASIAFAPPLQEKAELPAGEAVEITLHFPTPSWDLGGADLGVLDGPHQVALSLSRR